MHDVEREWVNEFTMQMTIQRATGDDIRMALADVRAHCADSGESARDAFGDPKEYATMLAAALPAGRRGVDPRSAGVLLLSVVALALLAVGSLSPNQPEDDRIPVTLGEALLVLCAVPAWVGLAVSPWGRRRPRDPAVPNRPAFDERYWRALWLTLGLAAVGTAMWLGLDQTLFTVSKWLFPSLGFALLIASQLLRWRHQSAR